MTRFLNYNLKGGSVLCALLVTPRQFLVCMSLSVSISLSGICLPSIYLQSVSFLFAACLFSVLSTLCGQFVYCLSSCSLCCLYSFDCLSSDVCLLACCLHSFGCLPALCCFSICLLSICSRLYVCLLSVCSPIACSSAVFLLSICSLLYVCLLSAYSVGCLYAVCLHSVSCLYAACLTI